MTVLMMSDLQSYLLGPWKHPLVCSFGLVLSYVALNLSDVAVCYSGELIPELLSSLVRLYCLFIVIYGDYIVS